MGDTMIDIRKLKEIVRLMVENDLSEIDLSDDQEKVLIKRGMDNAPVLMHAPAHHVAHAPMSAPAPAGAPAGSAPAAADDSDLHAITSPMVGTFYSGPDPESPAFVNVGAAVGPESVVCIVEAMKVFSEIKAECAGTIEKVLVKNGEPVEYGQKLFLVRPN